MIKRSSSDLELKSISNLLEYEDRITLADCVHAVPMIGINKKYHPVIKANIDLALNAVALAHGIEAGDDLVGLLTSDLFEKYKTDSYQDIILALKSLRQGVSGKLFGRLDSGMLAEAMKNHLEKKYQLREAQLSGFKSGDSCSRTIRPRSLKEIAARVGPGFSESEFLSQVKAKQL